MLSKLRMLSKYQKIVYVENPLTMVMRRYSVDKLEIVDINIEDMMYEDNELNIKTNDLMITEEPQLKSTDLDGAPIAPIDIDPWIQEDEYKEGTVHEESLERRQIISNLPEPPLERSGVYEFKGIKIVLPKKLLRSATYRYCADQEDIENLADDTRICKFEK